MFGTIAAAALTSVAGAYASQEQYRHFWATLAELAPLAGDASPRRDHSIDAAVKAHKQKMAEIEAETTRMNRWLLWGITAAILWGGYCIAQLAGIA